MNKQVEGWHYYKTTDYEAWCAKNGMSVYIYRNHKYRHHGRVWCAWIKSDTITFPRHANTLEKRMQYALAIARLEG